MAEPSNPGVYRGICIDNKDPQGLGRIRVQVPRVMGATATGWALPAWPLEDWTVWPEDRIPSTDQGVWVIFESPDRMTWIATYGEQQFSNQGKDDDVDETGRIYVYKTEIAWDFKALPLNVPMPITGTLTSPSGVPQPSPPSVHMQKAPDSNGAPGAWVNIPNTDAEVGYDGTWATSYTRPAGELNFWYRMSFTGTWPFWDCTGPEAQITNTATAVTWTPPALNWRNPVPISGALVDANNAGLVGEKVVIRTAPVGSSVWTDVAPPLTTTAGGAWTYQWTREYVPALKMKVSYASTLLHDSSESTEATLAAVTVPVLLSLTVPTMVFNTAATFTGSISSTSYGVPAPSTVQFWTRAPASTGTWVKNRDVTPQANGTFTFMHSQTDGTCDYKMVYPGDSAPWIAAETAPIARSVGTTTTVSAPVLPATLTHGTSFTATGTVKDSLNRAATSGTAKLWFRLTNGANTTWQTSAAPVVNVSASGSYTITHPALTFVGPVDWKVAYTGGGLYLDSESPSASKSIGLPAVASLTKTSTDLTVSSAKTSWTAVSGATEYEVVFTGATTAYQTAVSVTKTGLTAMTDYTFTVRARKADAGGNWVYGASASASLKTGRSAVSKSSGGNVLWTAYPTSTGSWSSYYGWSSAQANTRCYQGYFSNATVDWFGVMTYDGAAFQNAVRNAYGQDVLDNIQAVATSVYMKRVGNKTDGPSTGDHNITALWYVTPSTANSGGQPALAGGDWKGEFYFGTEGWVGLQAHWGKHVLKNEWIPDIGTINSFCLHTGEQYHYGAFAGKNDPGFCRMDFWYNWDFISVTAIATAWK